MTARKDFLQSLTLGKKSEPTAEYAPSLRSPWRASAVYDKNNHTQRNGNVKQLKALGRMAWQRIRQYGYRNYSELAIQRYKRILGSTLHARDFVRQKIESMIGCGVLNKMTRLGMPASYRCA
ncbi:hypothetical protein [Candidiatus Paracoxiella cheracis]|uniref:hypothetical protein n=1 Tax=Candidiatus Paracoxiella cheracis TaxID=3405120 RepID=UPI003BF4DDA4